MTALKKKEDALTPVGQELEDMMRADAGAGISNRPADNLIPQIKLLQPLSPQVLDGPGRVEGANAGDFLIGATPASGKKGIFFQPAAWQQIWLEFTPRERGGGFVRAYPYLLDDNGNEILPEGVTQVGPFQFTSQEGNNVQHYRQVAGFVWPGGLEYVISFKSTGHAVAKEWNTRAGRMNRYPNLEQRPLWAHIYHLTTSARRRKDRQWFQIDVGPAAILMKDQFVDDEALVVDPKLVANDIVRAYKLGRELNSALAKKEKRIATPDVESDEDREAM